MATERRSDTSRPSPMRVEGKEKGRRKRRARGKKPLNARRPSHMPENYPNLGKPSDCLKKEGKGIERDAESILDNFADVYQELPKGRTKGPSSILSPALPAEVPQYKRHTYPVSDNTLKKGDLSRNREKQSIISAQTQVAAPVFFVWKKDGSLRLVTDYRGLTRSL